MVVPEEGDLLPVGRPLGPPGRARGLRQLPRLPAARRHDPDVELVGAVVGVRVPVRDEGNPEPVRRPRGHGVVPVAFRQLHRSLVADPDDVEVLAFRIQEPRPLFLIVKARDVAERRLLLLLAERRVRVLAEHDHQTAAVRRPVQRGDLPGGRVVSGAGSPPEIDISQTWLSSSLVRTKAIRRPSGDQRGRASLTLPERERLVVDPEVLGVLLAVDDLDGVEHAGAVRRDLGVAGEAEARQVLGRDETSSRGRPCNPYPERGNYKGPQGRLLLSVKF
jgi:hypothetical protein